MNVKELEQILKVCKKYGVSHYKTPELELTCDTTDSTAPVATGAENLKTESSYTDEDILLWSAGN